MQPHTAQSSHKKDVNLTANAALIPSAKEKKINLSDTFEDAILTKLCVIQQQEWLKENREGIEAYNERIERNGLFASKFRKF